MTVEPVDVAALRQARILVVEDNPASARLASMVLRHHGAEVRAASSATEATRVVADGFHPAIILLDLDLPDLPGMQLVKVFRALDDTRDVPIVAVTGSGIAFGEKAALLSGCDGYVRKPIDVETFPAFVAGFLRPGWSRAGAGPAAPVQAALGPQQRAILEAIPKAVCVVRPDDLTIVYGNHKFAQMSGYATTGLAGLPLAITNPQGQAGALAVREQVRRDLDARGESTFEVPRLRADRTTIWIEVTATRLIDDEQGELWLMISDDVSHRRRVAADLKTALSRSESRFASLWDAGVLAIAVGEIAGERRLLDANQRFLDLIGWTRDDVVQGRVGRGDYSPPEYDAADLVAAQKARDGDVAPREKEYVRKDGRRVPVLVGSAAVDTSTYVSYAIDLTDKRRDQAALAESHRRFDALWRSGLIGIVISDGEGVLREANDAYLAIVGYTRGDLEAGLIRYTAIMPPEHQAATARAAEQMVTRGVTDPWETEILRKDGVRVPLLAGVAVIDAQQSIAIVSDLSPRRQAEDRLRRTEDQLRHAQKMEAVGRLAGGVAHDFNNLLTVILSYSDLLLAELGEGDPMAVELAEIHRAAVRASELTKQLLVFSRQQVIEAQVLDPNRLLSSMERMLRRVLGEDIDLTIVAGEQLGAVELAPSHFEQIIVNLAVNARDAMADGGALTIETANVELDEAAAQAHAPARPGRYVLMSISDTGCGMDRETQARIFEPFYTTKPVGKGTGLGLSIVFGIVQQSGGHVWVYSEPGHGTCFKVYLPRVGAQAEAPRVAAPPATLRGSETVLLVEDEDQVRKVAHGILRRAGYTVLEARNPGEALLICESHPTAIDLLLTDVVMPQMSGPELARRLSILRPPMRVLCMSGYTDDSVTRHKILERGVAFLQKPLTPDTLTRKVREVLEAAPPSASEPAPRPGQAG